MDRKGGVHAFSALMGSVFFWREDIGVFSLWPLIPLLFKNSLRKFYGCEIDLGFIKSNKSWGHFRKVYQQSTFP